MLAVLAGDSFESGDFGGGAGFSGNWTVAGDATVVSTNAPQAGTQHAQLRSSTADLQRAVDVSNLTDVRLQFWSKVHSFEGNDKALVSVSPNGSSWTTLLQLNKNQSDNTYRFHDLAVPTSGNTLYIRFDAAMNAADDFWFIDEVQVVGTPLPGVLPNDPTFPQLWPLHNTGQSGGTPDADIDAPEAWEITTGSMKTVIAVLDSGIDYTHPDVYLNIWINESEIPASIAASLTDVDGDGVISFRDLNLPANASHVSDFNGTGYIDAGDLLNDARWENDLDDDGNGFVDDLIGWDFHDGDNDPYASLAVADHGTHISQRLAATGNDGVGWVGVMWQARLMQIRINLNNYPGNWSTENCAAGIDYAVAEGASISNNSWMDNPYSQLVYDAIDRARLADHLFIAAAGNYSQDTDAVPFFPASYALDNVISVAALTANNQLSSITNWGKNSVHLGAPSDTGATSKATPMVTGVAGLLRTLHPDWTYAQIRDRILSTVDPIPALAGKSVTGGRLNAANALRDMPNFGTPFNLGIGVNTTDIEEGPTMTADGLNLLFHRSPTPSSRVIFEATRATIDVPFGNAVNVGPEVNFGPAHPAVSPDGLTLLFSAGDATGERLYQSTRASRNDPFGPAVSLGGLIGNQSAESPSLSSDGLTLFFTAWDSAHVTNDIYQASRNNVGDPWGNVVMLSSAVNVPGYNDAMPSISSDGLRLFFNSNRPGGSGAFDLYLATRSSLDSPWQPAVNLGPQVNTAYDDKGAGISSDGSLLYFHSNRPGGTGAEDLYAVTVGYDSPAATTISISDATASEGRTGSASQAVFNVSLIAPSLSAITVDYDIVGGNATADVDFVAGSGTITFAAGQTSRTILVETINDALVEANETFFINLSNPSGAVLADSQGVGTIIDDDAPHTKFYVVNDGSPDRTFEYASSGAGLENYTITSGNSAPRGAASNAAGDTVWVVDANKNVYVYSPSGTPLGSWTAGSLPSNANVQGVTTNGADVWIVDAQGDRIYRYTGAATRLSGSQNAASNFALSGSNKDPSDFVTDGNSIWVLNNTTSTDKVFKYSLSGSLLASWTITDGGGSPTGITIDPSGGTDMWIVDSARDTVYLLPAARNAANNSSVVATPVFALAADNANPQGIADPPVGWPVARASAVGSTLNVLFGNEALRRSESDVRREDAMPTILRAKRGTSVELRLESPSNDGDMAATDDRPNRRQFSRATGSSSIAPSRSFDLSAIDAWFTSIPR